tara:strand:+ start:414 stop:707 length:294 start_codon:yes stop_codon:yes gene_type:complete
MGILLDRFGDFFGIRTKNIFDTTTTPGSNWVELKLKDVWVELKSDRTDTSFKLLISDDIEQLERLAFWSGQLNKDVKKHIKKLKKKAKAEKKDKEQK